MSQRTYLKIPRDRIGVLIGPKGKAKRRIENFFKVTLEIDSESGAVEIILNEDANDITAIFTVKNIVQAIGRGFSPETAMLILKSDYAFELLSISDYLGKSKKKATRLKARIIGTEGKTRKHIEEITETNLSIYGKTIGIIGEAEHVMLARRAVESLLAGATHSSVYKWLEKKKKELERNRMISPGKIELKEGFEGE